MIKKDAIVSCPECDEPQMQAGADIGEGAQLKEAKWETLGFDFKSLTCSCHKCGALWYKKHPDFDYSQIHIKEKGWTVLSKKKPSIHLDS